MLTFKIQMNANHLKTVIYITPHNRDDVSGIDDFGGINDAGGFVGGGFMGEVDYAVDEFSVQQWVLHFLR